MDILNKGSSYLNKSVSVVSDNQVLGPAVAILLILFAVLVAPKLPSSVTLFVNNIYFKIIFILIIVLLAKQHLALSLISLIIFFIIINNKHTDNNTMYKTQKPLTNSKPQDLENEEPQYLQNEEPQALLEPSNSIPISIATNYALSDQMRTNTLNASIMPINKDMAPNAAATIVASTPMVDSIVSNIKDNHNDYVNHCINKENILRKQAENHSDTNISQSLSNSADKLVVGRNAVTAIVNNQDVQTNDQLIKALVKSELLQEASIEASKANDYESADQLKIASVSQSNIASALVQSNVLKETAQNMQNNNPIESANVLNIANAHLDASLNMIGYNNNMELSLDASFKGNHDQAKQYEQQANNYLNNNVTLNDSIKGLPIELSNKLYAQVPEMNVPNSNLIPPNIPPANRCDTIPAVDISGIEDNDYANF